MTVSPFLNVAAAATPDLHRSSQATIATVAVHCDLVRGTEDRVLSELMPRVKLESVALDLSDVERMDAAGIAALIALYCTAVESGTDFYVVSPSVRVLDMLRLVGLESILLPAVAPEERPQFPGGHRKFDLTAA